MLYIFKLQSVVHEKKRIILNNNVINKKILYQLLNSSEIQIKSCRKKFTLKDIDEHNSLKQVSKNPKQMNAKKKKEENVWNHLKDMK